MGSSTSLAWRTFSKAWGWTADYKGFGLGVAGLRMTGFRVERFRVRSLRVKGKVWGLKCVVVCGRTRFQVDRQLAEIT